MQTHAIQFLHPHKGSEILRDHKTFASFTRRLESLCTHAPARNVNSIEMKLYVRVVDIVVGCLLASSYRIAIRCAHIFGAHFHVSIGNRMMKRVAKKKKRQNQLKHGIIY